MALPEAVAAARDALAAAAAVLRPEPPPPPPLPPDLTLNLSYPPAPAMRQWQILVPCNHATAPPGPDPLLLGFIDLYHPLTVFAFVFTVCSVLFYYLRRWQLREEAKRAERVPTLDDEIKRSANLRHIKSMFEEVDIEEEEEEEEELDEWGRVKKEEEEAVVEANQAGLVLGGRGSRHWQGVRKGEKVSVHRRFRRASV